MPEKWPGKSKRMIAGEASSYGVSGIRIPSKQTWQVFGGCVVGSHLWLPLSLNCINIAIMVHRFPLRRLPVTWSYLSPFLDCQLPVRKSSGPEFWWMSAVGHSCKLQPIDGGPCRLHEQMEQWRHAKVQWERLFFYSQVFHTCMVLCGYFVFLFICFYQLFGFIFLFIFIYCKVCASETCKGPCKIASEFQDRPR